MSILGLVLDGDTEMGPLLAELIERSSLAARDPGDAHSTRTPGAASSAFIEGRLRVEPFPELGFETVVELTTGRAVITPTEG